MRLKSRERKKNWDFVHRSTCNGDEEISPGGEKKGVGEISRVVGIEAPSCVRKSDRKRHDRLRGGVTTTLERASGTENRRKVMCLRENAKGRKKSA